MKTGFATLHPLVQLTFFISCLSVNMFIMHPVILIISWLCSSIYIIYSWGINNLIFVLKINIVSSLMIILINPLISHRGITVLAYLPSGNVITLESIIFGCAAALLMSSVVNWFFCFNKVITSDKIIYLFGKIFPKIALLISMILSFTGKFSAQLDEVKAAQFSLEHCKGKKSIVKKIKLSVRVMSAMIQWSLENSVDTADSMHSRGYGTAKRTNYSIYKLRKTDIIYVIVFVIADVLIYFSSYLEIIYFSYYPVIDISFENNLSLLVLLVYALMCIVPVMTDLMEERKWNYLKSKI